MPITHSNRAEQSATFLAMLAAFKCGNEPTNNESARRIALAEAVSFHADDLYIIVALANAIEDYCEDAGPLEYTTFKMAPLKALAAPRIVTLAAQLAGFIPRPVRGRTVWSNSPLEFSGDTNTVAFEGIMFDGIEIKDA